MRKTKRFTPAVLDRFEREARGKGVGEDYLPWHRVSRSDPSSSGRSHLAPWRDGRSRELLSDGEWVALLFILLTGEPLLDVREQFPLSTERRIHELADYHASASKTMCEGTLAIAEKLGVRHPRIVAKDARRDWVGSTDLLIALQGKAGRPKLLAIACKESHEIAVPRKRQLLSIERQYWIDRRVEWLLITPDQYDARVARTLRRTFLWATEDRLSKSILENAASIVLDNQGKTYTRVIRQVEACVGSADAQKAFWQAVWQGYITVDLRMTWQPHRPVHILSREQFRNLNPIAMRRTAWI